jgi:hypothetical protein
MDDNGLVQPVTNAHSMLQNMPRNLLAA